MANKTVVDNVLLRGQGRTVQLELALETPDTSRLHEAWDAAAEREKRQRGYFDQQGIKPDGVGAGANRHTMQFARDRKCGKLWLKFRWGHDWPSWQPE